MVFFEDEKIIWSWRCLKLSTHEGTVREKIVPLGDAQEKGVKGGYFEWLTQNPYETGAVVELAGGIILAYRLAQEGVSLEDLNAQFLAEQLSKGYAMTAAKFANAVGALVERKLFFTPGKIPGGQQQGEMGNMEDSQTSVKLPKTVKGMKITGTRGYIDIEYNGKTARFSGEMCIDGFAAIASSMKWLPPYENLPITEKERLSLIHAVLEDVKNDKYKVFFTNDQYEDIDFN